MRALWALLGGGAVGIVVARVAPEPARTVVRGVEQLGLDRALSSAALAALPAGDEREACESIVSSVVPPALDA